MKVIQTNNRTWCFVGVPEGADNFYAKGNTFGYITYIQGKSNLAHGISNLLPPGKWSIHCDTQTITEEQAAQICESNREFRYRDYRDSYLIPFETALYSFKTLTEHHSLHGRQIILELLNNEK